jgi:hypothetical protein
VENSRDAPQGGRLALTGWWMLVCGVVILAAVAADVAVNGLGRINYLPLSMAVLFSSQGAGSLMARRILDAPANRQSSNG